MGMVGKHHQPSRVTSPFVTAVKQGIAFPSLFRATQLQVEVHHEQYQRCLFLHSRCIAVVRALQAVTGVN